jgi:hypothetical protein
MATGGDEAVVERAGDDAVGPVDRPAPAESDTVAPSPHGPGRAAADATDQLLFVRLSRAKKTARLPRDWNRR